MTVSLCCLSNFDSFKTPGQFLSHSEQWEVSSHQAAESFPGAAEGMAADQGHGRAMATRDPGWNTEPLVTASLNCNTDYTSKRKISDLSISCSRVFWEKLPNTSVFLQVGFTKGKMRNGKAEYSKKYH